MSIQLLFHLEVFISGYFLWLGLYILTRSLRVAERPWHERLDWHAALAMLLASFFLLGIAMEFVSQTADEYALWLRLTWWGLPPSAGLWFRLTLFAPHQMPSTRSATPRWKQWVSAVVVLFGFAYGAANLVTDYFFAFDAVELYTNDRFGSFFFAAFRPAYYIHAVYFLGVIYVTVFLWWQMWRQMEATSPQKKPLQYILSGGALIAVAASLTIFNYILWDYRFPQPLSDLVAAVGLGIVGRNLIDYNAILDQRILLSDYRRTFAGMALYIAGMLPFFHVTHWLAGQTMSFVTTPLLVGVSIFLSTTIPFFQVLLNRWTLPEWEAQFLQELESVETQVLTAENQQQALLVAQNELDSITRTAQNEQLQERVHQEIGRIFRHNTYHKDEALAASDLFELHIVQVELTRFAAAHQLAAEQVPEREKAGILRQLLQAQVSELQPAETGLKTAEIEQQQIEYLILHLGYIDKRTREEIISQIEEIVGLRLLKNSRAYTLHLNRARQRLGNQIWLLEAAARPLTP